MKIVKRIKFDWGHIDESNCGHTKDEWGKITENRDEQKPRIIHSYKVRWETEE